MTYDTLEQSKLTRMKLGLADYYGEPGDTSEFADWTFTEVEAEYLACGLNEIVAASELRDGDMFSLDDDHWHICAVNMSAMGTVSVYATTERGDDAPTVRVDMPKNDDTLVYIREIT